MSNHEIEMSVSQITEHIFVGSNFCCETHFDTKLLAQGVRADISLQQEQLDNPHGVEFFLWLPTPDNNPSTEDQYGVGIVALDYYVRHNIKVYVHCMNGHGRAPAMVAAYFIRQGMTAEDAVTKIAEKRPEIHLEQSQIDMLKTLEQKFSK